MPPDTASLVQRVREFKCGGLAADDVNEKVEPAPVHCRANSRPAGEFDSW